MKRLITILSLLLCFVVANAQGGSLKFLGIPIDGSEARFASQLKGKGFRYDALYECYKGQFNGKNVDVFLHTNHNVVDRVYVSFPYTSEEGIRVEYNTLLAQFKENVKYADLVLNKQIPEEDDISYEMSVHNKRYQASFCYFDPDRDPTSFMETLVDRLSDFFSEDQKRILKRYASNLDDYPADQQEALREQMMLEWLVSDKMQHPDDEQSSERAIQLLSKALNEMQSLADGSVWFMIHEHYGRYSIGLYYDNLHNQAHGEDL